MSKPTPGYIPTVRARRLIRGLVDARKAAGMTATHAAKSLGWSQPRLSHIENFRSKPSVDQVTALLELYGVATPEREALIALASQVERRGWWTEYEDVFSGAFAALEDDAETIREWAPLCFPGLLQTRAYARAVIELGRPADPAASPEQQHIREENIRRRVAARMLRQEVLTRSSPARFHTVVDEALLRRPIGGREVLREQLHRLAAEATRPNITVQVLPMNVEDHAGLEGHFIVMSFGVEDEPDVGYAEGIYGTVYLESPLQVSRCTVTFERLSECALSPQESLALIKAAAKE